MSVIFDVVSPMDNLGSFSLDRNETKMTIEAGIVTELNCMLFLTIRVKGVGITQRSTKLPTTDQPAQSVEHRFMVREIGSYPSAPSRRHQVICPVNSLKNGCI